MPSRCQFRSLYHAENLEESVAAVQQKTDKNVTDVLFYACNTEISLPQRFVRLPLLKISSDGKERKRGTLSRLARRRCR